MAPGTNCRGPGTITAVTTVGDRFLAPLPGQVRSPGHSAKKPTWTPIDGDCAHLR